MATSGYKDVSVVNYITLRFSWSSGTQNITSNYTPVSWKLQLISSNSSANISSSASKDYSVTVDGKTWSGTNTVGLSGGATKTLASGSKNIYHSSDGTKTFDYSFSQEIGITYSGSAIGTKSGSGTGTLNTIPRASILGTISSFTFGSAINIPITKYSSSFTDTLVISVGGTTIKTISDIANGYDVSFTTTELNNIYAKLPSATKGTVTFKLTTKSGSTTIGTSTKTSTGTIPTSVKPTISGITLSEAVSGLASKFGAYIQNQSKISGTINASAGSGSSISAYKTTINGSSYTSKTFTTGVLKTSGTNTISTTVTDKRGRSTSYSTTFSVLAYTKPTISTFKVERCNADGTLNDEGVNFKVTIKSSITSLNSKNDSTYLLQYKLSSVDNWTTIGNSLSGYSINTNWVVTNIALNIDNVYDFRLTISDYFEDIIKTINVAESFTLMNFGADGHSMAIGGVAEEPDVLDIKMKKTYISDNAYMGGDSRNDNEKNLFYRSTGEGEYIHNAKLYGGNGTSPVAIGMWDSTKALPIFQYFDGEDYRFKFGDDILLRWGNYDIEATIEKVIDVGVGRIHYKNGLLIQWGMVSITPSAANTPTLTTITFPKTYDESPSLKLSCYTTVPGTSVLGYAHGAVRENNADIYLTRTNTSSTALRWIAFGFKEV